MADARVEISVVVPIRNDAPVWVPFLRTFCGLLERAGNAFEAIAVDDGSTDTTFDALLSLREELPQLRILRLTRSFGAAHATLAGLAHARGKAVLVTGPAAAEMAETLPELLRKLDEGYDVVSGTSPCAPQARLARAGWNLARSLARKATRGHIHDFAFTGLAMSNAAAQRLLAMPQHTPFLLADVAGLGLRTLELPLGTELPQAPVSIREIAGRLFHIFTAITLSPLRIIGFAGWAFACVGFLMAALILARRLIFGNYNPFATITALFFVLSGIQLIATGIMCQYVARIFVEVQAQPYYVVKDVLEKKDAD